MIFLFENRKTLAKNIKIASFSVLYSSLKLSLFSIPEIKRRKNEAIDEVLEKSKVYGISHIGTGFGFRRLLQTHAATAVLQGHDPFGAMNIGKDSNIHLVL